MSITYFKLCIYRWLSARLQLLQSCTKPSICVCVCARAKKHLATLFLPGSRLHTLCVSFTNTVYPKKYAHGFCFAVLCCGYTLTDFPISIWLTSLALWQSNDCPSASKAALMNMDKYFMWIHYERLQNHNKAKHNKTVCIFLGIYCIVNSILYHRLGHGWVITSHRFKQMLLNIPWIHCRFSYYLSITYIWYWFGYSQLIETKQLALMISRQGAQLLCVTQRRCIH